MKPQIYILKNTHLEVHISTLGATLTRMLTKGRERFAGKGCRCVAGYGKGRRLRIAGIYC